MKRKLIALAGAALIALGAAATPALAHDEDGRWGHDGWRHGGYSRYDREHARWHRRHDYRGYDYGYYRPYYYSNYYSPYVSGGRGCDRADYYYRPSYWWGRWW